MKYKQVKNVKAKIENGYLYVRTTGCDRQGRLQQGMIADQTYRQKYSGSLNDATEEKEWGVDDIQRLLNCPECIIRKGRVIQ